MRYDIVVIGAGLAGLTAARRLAKGGTDVVVLEARGRPGGRVEQTELADGRLVQLGGEVVAPFHTAYTKLVEELGLTIVPGFPSLPGEETFVLADRDRLVGEGFPFFGDEDRRSYERVEGAFRRLAQEVDPDDPWSHARARELDAVSVSAWLRAQGATPNVVRARELVAGALAAESNERTSLLSDLRKEAAAGAHGFYDYDVWECQRVAEGSATVALRVAAELGHRIRYATPVTEVRVSSSGCTVLTATGERFESEAVICALPVGPLRRVRVEGVSAERLASLHRQKNALVAKAVFVWADSFWERNGQNGDVYAETGLIGGTWTQRKGIMSTLVPPERFGPFLATPEEELERTLTDEMAVAYGEEARALQAFYVRRWGADPWTRGYITAWRPGDVMAVGPLHGTHEPPFYVCGSDQWVCGYMEGAVRTGSAAAEASCR
ncbi:MAG: flavin monoamine oxidase family protein [Thermoleophilaceae bacterium]